MSWINIKTNKVYPKLPKSWKNKMTFDKRDLSEINSDGFYELVYPKIEKDTHKYGSKFDYSIIDGKAVVPVENKNSFEIKEYKKQKLYEKREQKFSEKFQKDAQKNLINELNIKNDAEKYESVEVFEKWESGKNYVKDIYVWDFDEVDDIRLYFTNFVLEPSTVNPKDDPQNWTAVPKILPYDPRRVYNTGDQVYFSNNYWESEIDINTQEPSDKNNWIKL